MRNFIKMFFVIAVTIAMTISCSKEEEKYVIDDFKLYNMEWVQDDGTLINTEDTIVVSSNGGKYHFKCILGDYNSSCIFSEETDEICTSNFFYDCPTYTSSWYIADFTKPKELSLSISPNTTKKKRLLQIEKWNGMWRFFFVFKQAAK